MASSLVKTAQCFVDDAGNKHDTALQCLVANKRIAVRGLFQQGIDGVQIRNGTVATEDAVKIIAVRAKEFAEICKKYDYAITRERAKGGNP